MDLNLNNILILLIVWTLKSIISNFWLFKVGGDFINHGTEITPIKITLNDRIKHFIVLPGVIGLLPIYFADISTIVKIIFAVFMLDPYSYKILKLPSSFLYPDLRTGYKYHQYLKNNPIDMMYMISVSSNSFGLHGAALLIMNKKMLKERILEDDNKKQKLLDLLSEDNFVSYFYKNHSDFYNLYKVFLGSNNKAEKLDPLGIEIAAHILTRDENDKYFVYIRDELMRE